MKKNPRNILYLSKLSHNINFLKIDSYNALLIYFTGYYNFCTCCKCHRIWLGMGHSQCAVERGLSCSLFPSPSLLPCHVGPLFRPVTCQLHAISVPTRPKPQSQLHTRTVRSFVFFIVFVFFFISCTCCCCTVFSHLIYCFSSGFIFFRFFCFFLFLLHSQMSNVGRVRNSLKSCIGSAVADNRCKRL